MITQPGIYDMPAAEYHADPVHGAPSLSSHLAHVLLTQSPQHAMWAHPKLSPAFRREEREEFDLGTACHSYLLEGDVSSLVIVDAKDWKKKEAQEARVAARAEGKVALLTDQWLRVQAMAGAVRAQLRAHAALPMPFGQGRAEETLVWQEGDVWCRARLDWLHKSNRFVDDLKTTSGTANPEAWTRGPLFSSGYDLQAAFYLRGLRVVLGVEAEFRFVVVEQQPPYALSVIALGPDALVLAEKKRMYAVNLWRQCLESGEWPGYPMETCHATLPEWEEKRWLAREEATL